MLFRVSIITVLVLFGGRGVSNAALDLSWLQDNSPGLSGGQQYRLVFLTSTFVTATSDQITTYNDVADSAGAAVDIAARSLGITLSGDPWTAIASTPTVDAKDNTGTDPSIGGIPIYLVNGELVANNYADLWDGSIRTGINVFETGDSIDPPNLHLAFTGTHSDGTAISVAGGHGPLGGAGLLNGIPHATWGDTSRTDSGWVSRNVAGQNTQHPLYALSAVQTYSGIPEPMNVLLFAAAIAVTGTLRRIQGRVFTQHIDEVQGASPVDQST